MRIHILASGKEERTYREYFHSRCKKFFTSAVQIGQSWSGITVRFNVETKVTFLLTDDCNYVRSITSVRKSFKMKFVKLPKSISEAASENLQHLNMSNSLTGNLVKE